MSERPRDEEELQAFLAGESALSRRYKESSDEQPPAHVDAAITAAARWAVGADENRDHQRRIGSHYTGLQHTGAHRTGARWRRSSVARWSVPLATAAVVVVAATLTLMIERDPEIDQIYDRHDASISGKQQDRVEIAAGKAENAAPQASAPSGAPAVPVAPRVSAPPSVTASPPLSAKEKASQLEQQKIVAARKRSETLEREPAKKQFAEPAALAPPTEADIATNVVQAEKPAEAFPDSVGAVAESRPDDDAVASIGMARDESAPAGVVASAEEKTLTESVVETTPGRQQTLTPSPQDEPAVADAFSDQDAPGRLAEAEAVRDPAAWIEDIEELLAQGKREEAIASLEEFRLDYPEYQLPQDLLSLLPARTD